LWGCWTEPITRFLKAQVMTTVSWVLGMATDTLMDSKAVLATGTDQILPPIPGIKLDNVQKIRRTEDLKSSMSRIEKLQHISILGAGYIGLEFALALKNMGKDVRIIEMADHIMGGRIDISMAEAIEAHLAEGGIEIICGHAATRILGEKSVEGVELDDGRNFTTDGILSAVGVRPMMEAAEAMKLLSGKGEINRGMIMMDLWDNTFEQFGIAGRNPDCPACGRGEYRFLNAEAGTRSVTLCGRNAVQITNPGVHLSLPDIAERLQALGRVTLNDYLLRAHIDDYELTLFPDGRAIIKGVEDPDLARSLYARYVGA